jgi:hypothetical protein
MKLDSENINDGNIEYYIIQIPKFRKYVKKAIKKYGMETFINCIKNNKLYRILLYLDIKTDKKIIDEVIKMDLTINKLHEEAETERLHKDLSGNMSEFLKAYNKAEQEDIHWNKVRESGKKEGIREGEEKGKKKEKEKE